MRLIKSSNIIQLSIILCSIFQCCIAKAQNFELGTVHDSIITLKDSSLYYSLYLPNSYAPDSPSAVMYVFDPAGNEFMVFSKFKELAEEYNYIIACSPLIRNGPYELMLGGAELMINDIESRFSVNKKRRYLAGFSGGSRMAITIANLSRAFEGVIGCGAGQPILEEFQSSQDNQFLYYGFVGDHDYNYIEMLDHRDWLDSLGIKNQLSIFKGSHRWPTMTSLSEAFAWFDLKAMKKGISSYSTQFIDSIYHNYLYKGDKLLMQNDLIELEKHYNYILETFSDWKDVSSIHEKRKKLIETKEFLLAEEIHADENYIESAFINRIKELATLVFTFGRYNDVQLFEWKSIHKELKKMHDEFPWMTERILSSMVSFTTILGEIELSESNFKSGRNLFTLQKEIIPDSFQPYLLFSKSYALEGNGKKALKHFKKAVDKGFKDFDQIIKDPSFQSLISMKKFQELYL